MRPTPNHVKSKLVTPAMLAAWLGITTAGVKQAEVAGRIPRAQRTPGGLRRWPAVEILEHFRERGLVIPAELLALAEPAESSDPPEGS